MKKTLLKSGSGMAVLGVIMTVLFLFTIGPVNADTVAAKKWIDAEFQPSTLSKADQLKEMEWFIKAAAPFKGMSIKVVSETIPTHEYESKVLAKAFLEITGIEVTHDLIQEGDVIEKLQIQMQSGENVFDGYINDSDLIGTHYRYGHVVNLTDWMVQDESLISIRSKSVQLPQLEQAEPDRVTTLKAINLFLPTGLLLIFGAVRVMIHRRRQGAA